MPTTLTGRELIQRYIDKNEISVTSLAAMYGISKTYMSDILSGKKTGSKPNAIILRIIEDFKLGIKN